MSHPVNRATLFRCSTTEDRGREVAASRTYFVSIKTVAHFYNIISHYSVLEYLLSYQLDGCFAQDFGSHLVYQFSISGDTNIGDESFSRSPLIWHRLCF